MEPNTDNNKIDQSKIKFDKIVQKTSKKIDEKKNQKPKKIIDIIPEAKLLCTLTIHGFPQNIYDSESAYVQLANAINGIVNKNVNKDIFNQNPLQQIYEVAAVARNDTNKICQINIIAQDTFKLIVIKKFFSQYYLDLEQYGWRQPQSTEEDMRPMQDGKTQLDYATQIFTKDTKVLNPQVVSKDF